MGFLDHISLRGLNLYKQHAIVDSLNEIVTFYLYDLQERLVGYQQYNWKGSKHKRSTMEGKYYSYITSGRKGIWGLDTLDPGEGEPIYLVEGIWDAIAIQRLGLNAIAVLCNNPKHLTKELQQLRVMYNTDIVAVCDGDTSGLMLAKYSDSAVRLPEGEDASSLDPVDLAMILLGEV